MPQYFEIEPQACHDEKSYRVEIAGVEMHFLTDRAVFSRERLDFGSRLLIEQVLGDPAWHEAKSLVDLGCAYGAIGLSFKKIAPQKRIWLLDCNQRALDLARRNCPLNGIREGEGLDILSSDVLSALTEKVDLVVSNPPIRAGKATVFRFYEESFLKLNAKGSLLLVIQKKQGADSTEKELRRIFGNCQEIARDKGYRIYKARKEEAAGHEY